MMSAIHLTVVAGLILVFSRPADVSARCTARTVARCIEPLHKYGLSDSATIVPSHDVQTMKAICRDFLRVEDCLDPIKSSCSVQDQLIYAGIEKSYQYICEETFSEYVEYHDCLQNPYLHHEGAICNETFSRRMQSMSIGHYTNDYKESRLCNYAKDYIDCVYNLVNSFCGKDAAKWQRNLDINILAALLQYIKCDLSKYGSGRGHFNMGTVWMAMIILGLVLAILSFIFGFVGSRRRRQRRLQEQELRRQAVGDIPRDVLVVDPSSEVTGAGESDNADMATWQPPAYTEKDMTVPDDKPPAYDNSTYYGYDDPRLAEASNQQENASPNDPLKY